MRFRRWLMRAPTIYVQLSPELLTVRNILTGDGISEAPELVIAYDPRPGVVAVGSEARSADLTPQVQVVNPFSHPRSLVSDFSVGEQVLKGFLRRLQERFIFIRAPKLVLHPQVDPAGGFTQIEIRALHAMGMGAGAAKVVVWQGRRLSDEELLSGKFPNAGRVLA